MPARPRAAAPSVDRCGADSRRGARAARHRPEPARAGGESAAAADGSDARRRSRRWTCRASGVTRSKRFADSKSRRARPACPNEVVLAARYALCAGLDEAVLSTPWGDQSEWAQHPLLVALHREAWGGEKFFEMLDRISQDPTRYIDLMELQYLGHRLRLRRQVPGAGARARAPRWKSSRTSTARFAIIAARPSPSCRCAGADWRIGAIRSLRYVPWWVVGAAALPILAITFTVYYASLASARRPGACGAREGGPGGLFAATPRPRRCRVRRSSSSWRPTNGAARSAWRSKATGRRSRCSRGDLFPSGSATVNPAYHRDAAAADGGAEQGSGPRAGGGAHRRSTDQVAPSTRTTSSCRASAP